MGVSLGGPTPAALCAYRMHEPHPGILALRPLMLREQNA